MIRQSVFAGSWYPNDPVLLGRLIERAKEPKEGAFTLFAVRLRCSILIAEAFHDPSISIRRFLVSE